MSTNSPWPDLPLSQWSETCETLHRWTQVVGKVRMALTPLGQSLVERHALRHVARAHHLAHRRWHAHVRNRLRFRRSPPADRDQRRRDRAHRFGRDVGGGFPCRGHGSAAAPRHRCAHLDDAERDRERRSLRAGSRPCALRSRHGAAVLAGPGPVGPRAQDLPVPLHRQGQSRPFLLGEFRPRGDALLRPHGAASRRCHAQRGELGHGRGLFARGQQLRFLAGQRRLRESGLLRVCVSRAGGLWRHAVEHARSLLRQGPGAVHPALRCRPAIARPDALLLGFLQETYEAAATRANWDRQALERASAPGS
jgi:hypothetical protein